MAKQEELLERYEDALFTLLMNGVAEAEGKCLMKENAQLRGDPDAAVPEELNKRCLRTINRAFAKENMRSVRRVGKKVLQRVAVAILAAILLASAAFAISPEFRAKTLNLLIEVSDLATSLQLKGDSSVPATPEDEGVVLMGYRFPSPPEGFAKGYELITDQCEAVIYQNEDGAEIEFTIRTADGKILDVDTEGAQTAEIIMIHGQEGRLTEKQYEIEGKLKNKVSIAWGDKGQNIFLSIKCSNLDRETVITLAQQVEYIQSSEE